jgi:methylmalonyl-CoA/ethylmalonyl-CoA epimerase
MTPIRRLDHVAVVVRDTDDALRHFEGRLGLEVVHSEELETPHVRLTYLDAGNAYVQLVQPLDPDGELGRWLAENGEGLHHLCFGTEDPVAAAGSVAVDGAPAPVQGSGRGRISSFVPGAALHGVRVEYTEFRQEEDAGGPGFLDGARSGRAETAPGPVASRRTR